ARQPAPAQAQPTPRLGARRHLEFDRAAQGRHADARAQRRLPGRDLQRVEDVAAVDLEARMGAVLDFQQQVAAALTQPRQADHLAGTDPARDLDVQRAAVDRDAHGTALVHGFQRHHQARTGVAARRGAEAGPAALLRLAPEQAFEEVAEAAVAVAAAAAEDLLVVEARPAAVAAAEAPRRWVDVVTRPVAAAAQLVVGLAAPGVAKRFVGLVDRLELVLGTGLLADVGMVFACKAPVGGLDLGVAGTGLDTQDRVVILELHAVSTRATAAVRRGGRLAISG